jgi:hypothetical protein
MLYPDLPREAHRKITKPIKTADVQTVMRYDYTKHGVTPCSLVHRRVPGKPTAESSMFLRNVATYLQNSTASRVTRPRSRDTSGQPSEASTQCGMRVALFEGFLALPACPSYNSSINIKMSIGHYVTYNMKPQIYQNINLKSFYLRENFSPASQCSIS